MKKTIIAFAVLGILLLASIGAYASSISDKQAQAWEQALKGETRADLPEWIFIALQHLEQPIWYSAMVKHILSGSNANRMIAAIISLSAPTSLHLKKLGE